MGGVPSLDPRNTGGIKEPIVATFCCHLDHLNCETCRAEVREQNVYTWHFTFRIWAKIIVTDLGTNVLLEITF